MIDFSKIKSKKEVGKCFDYAILPKQTTEQTIRDCCKEAIKYNCKRNFCRNDTWNKKSRHGPRRYGRNLL